MNPTRLANIYQYALLLAAEEDWNRCELGPIHLLKFAYLADLAYAEHNGGETYTGVDWTFHHFGPWSVEANSAIEPALLAIGAEKRDLPSDYDGDFIRYGIKDDPEHLKRRERDMREQIPMEIRGTLQKAVHNFSSDTKKLLHAVYATAPMLVAAPGEHLDFQQAVREPQAVYATAPAKEPATALSKKKQSQLRSRMAELRKNCRRNFEAAKAERARLQTREHPEELAEVAAWLDRMAGPEFPDKGATVRFSDEVWKSGSRRGEDFDDVSG